MSIALSAGARARLDAHLDAVERILVSAGHPREHRRAVTDDLEAQILEMLAARSQSPTLADVEAVLAQLDPPSAYAGMDRPAPPVAAARSPMNATPPAFPAPPAPSAPSASASPQARRGPKALWIIACLLLGILLLAFAYPISSSLNPPMYPPHGYFNTYTNFNGILRNGSLVTIELQNNGAIVTIVGTYRDGRIQQLVTQLPSSALDDGGLKVLESTAKAANTNFLIRKPGSPTLAVTLLIVMFGLGALLLILGVILVIVVIVRNHGPAVAPAPGTTPRYSRMAIAGFVFILLSFLSPMCLLPIGFFFFASRERATSNIHRTLEAPAHEQAAHNERLEKMPENSTRSAPASEPPSNPNFAERSTEDETHGVAQEAPMYRSSRLGFVKLFLFLPIFPFGLMGTLFGWIAFFQIRSSRGALTGTGMALFDGLFYPILFTLMIPLLLLFMG